MAKHRFDLGTTFETLTQDELGQELHRAAQISQQEMARSVKYMRFGPFSTSVASNAFKFDGTTLGIGPREGFVWTIRRMSIDGLNSGATPDIANIYRNNVGTGPRVWQFNGNNFAYTFGKTELLLLGGETVSLVSAGSIAATGTILWSADYLEVAAEEIFKLL